jgi:hypothetical protein
MSKEITSKPVIGWIVVADSVIIQLFLLPFGVVLPSLKSNISVLFSLVFPANAVNVNTLLQVYTILYL